jgi:hypothetical protein
VEKPLYGANIVTTLASDASCLPVVNTFIPDSPFSFAGSPIDVSSYLAASPSNIITSPFDTSFDFMTRSPDFLCVIPSPSYKHDSSLPLFDNIPTTSLISDIPSIPLPTLMPKDSNKRKDSPLPSRPSKSQKSKF